MSEIALASVDGDALIANARALLQNAAFSEAVDLCDQVLADQPENTEALYTKAIALRFQRDIQGALRVVTRLIEIDPGNGRAHQERGHCLRDTGDTAGSFAAYQDAVTRNAALLASWKMLSRLHADAGRDEAADFADTQSEYLGSRWR